MKIKPQVPLPRNVRLLGWVSFFTDVSSEMIFPLLPAFLTTFLGASPFALGIIEGASDSISSLFKLFSGYYSDRLKERRALVLFGYGLSSSLRPLIGLASSWFTVFGLRFGDRIGKGIRSVPRDALIASSADADQRGWAFGYHQMMDHIGAVVGSLIGAGLIYLAPGQYRKIFLAAFLPALCAFFILWKVRDKETSERIVQKDNEIFQKGFLKFLPSRLKVFFALLFLFTLGNATDAFLLLRLQERGTPIALLPLLWAAFHVIKAYGNAHFGRLSDHKRKGLLILAGWGFYSVVYAVFALPLSEWQTVCLFLGYGLFYGLTESPEKGLLAEWASSSHYGSVYGIYNMIQGITLLPASLLFGLLWKLGGAQMAFTTAAGITFLSALCWGIYYTVFSEKN